MGEIRVKARLENLKDLASRRRRKPRGVELDAVVDTGAVMILLPQDAVEALGLEVRGSIVVALANDQKIELARTDAFRLVVAGRETFTDALVGPPGCEALIGQLVLERLDLIPDPVKRTLTPRPESPFLPTLKLKRAAAHPSLSRETCSASA